MITDDDIMQLEHLHLPHQYYKDFRYFAEPVPGFGVAIYTIPAVDAYCMACFPVPKNIETLGNCFVKHIGKMAGRMMPYEVEKQLRDMYPYRVAHDPLTLKCLIDEAVLNWRKLNVQSDEANP